MCEKPSLLPRTKATKSIAYVRAIRSRQNCQFMFSNNLLQIARELFAIVCHQITGAY
jgi:hypothetical protein